MVPHPRIKFALKRKVNLLAAKGISTSRRCQLTGRQPGFGKNAVARLRLHNRDAIDGRRRDHLRAFGVSRIRLRELAHAGYLPGVRKSSW